MGQGLSRASACSASETMLQEVHPISKETALVVDVLDRSGHELPRQALDQTVDPLIFEGASPPELLGAEISE